MYKDLKNKVALITGATRGIGRGIAENFALQGVKLILNYGSDEIAAKDTIEKMKSLKIDFLMVKANVADKNDIEKIFKKGLEHYGKIDIVVANAGIEIVDVPFIDYSESDFDKVFNLNVKGTFFVMQQAAKEVTDGGRIILISSTQSLNVETGAAVYAASKTASKKFVEILSKEIGKRNITVNSIMPGVIDNAGVITNLPEEFKQLVKSNSPFDRLGTVEDVARITAFIASAESGYINGAHIKANGGSNF